MHVAGSAWCQGMMDPNMGAAALQHLDPTAAWYYHYSQSQFAATALNTAAFYLTQASAHHALLLMSTSKPAGRPVIPGRPQVNKAAVGAASTCACGCTCSLLVLGVVTHSVPGYGPVI